MAGVGGEGDNWQPLCDGCTTVADAESKITDLEVLADRVYWTEHGTFDDLDNYNDNGRLLARAVEGGPVEVLADDLPGPLDLELSDDYAYLVVDELSGNQRHGIVRLPLAGGPLETLQTGARLSLTTNATSAFFASASALYRVDDDSSAPPVLLVDGLDEVPADWPIPQHQAPLLADSENVYVFKGLTSSPDHIDVIPVAGGELTLFGAQDSISITPLSIDEEYVYALDYVDHYGRASLARITKSGADSERLVMRRGADWFGLRGEQFFAKYALTGGPQQYTVADVIVQGNLSDPTAQHKLFIGEVLDAELVAVSDAGLFFAGNGRVQLAPYLILE